MWGRRGWLIAALAATMATQAGACEVERDALVDALIRNGYSIEEEGAFTEQFSACRIRNMVVADRALTLDIGLLEWRLDGRAAVQTGAGVAKLSATLKDLRMIPSADDPWIGFMLREQNRRNTIDGDVSATWDLDRARLEIETLTLDLPGDNAVSLNLLANGVPAAVLRRPLNAAAAELDRFELVMTNTGFADGLILSALGRLMSGLPGTPERQMDATKSDARARVGDLPDDLLNEDSKAALLDVIDELPVPWGTLAVTVTADPALPLLRFPALALSSNPFDPAALSFAFDGAEIGVTFTPDPGPE